MQNESRFRLNGIHLFFTYPQCPVDKQLAYDFLNEKFSPELILVAQEMHTDGHFHLHAYLKLFTKINTINNRFADLFIDGQTYHGNYQTCRSAKACLKYVQKDGNFIGNFDPKKTTNQSLRTYVCEKIVAGSKLEDLVAENPSLLFGYSRFKLDVLTYRRDIQARQVIPLPPFLPNPWSMVLPSKRHGKRRHYWLWSEKPNVGKTFLFAKPLASEYGAHIQSNEFNYWNISESTNCVILDEYNVAGLKFNVLNAMCDGTFPYRVFQGGVVRLADPLIIVLSNRPISDMYPHMNELLYARFNEKKLD